MSVCLRRHFMSMCCGFLQETLQSGKKRLYFLARDGYQMYLAAQQLCKQYDLDIECQISQSVKICGACAGISSSRERCLERICVGGIDVTFEKNHAACSTDRQRGRGDRSTCRVHGELQKSHQLSRGHAVKKTA